MKFPILLVLWSLVLISAILCEKRTDTAILKNDDRAEKFTYEDPWLKSSNNTISYELNEDESTRSTFKYKPPELELQFLHMNVNGLTIGTRISPGFNNMAGLLGGILLHTAVEENDLNMIESLIDIGADLNIEDNQGLTPLYKALETNNPETTKLLMDAGANIDFISTSGNTLVHNSVVKNDVVVLQRLLQSGADVDAPNSDGVTPLYKAAESMNHQAIETLLSRNANVDWKSKTGRSLLHIAVNWGVQDVAKQLIQMGAEIDSVDKEGATPLFTALVSNNPTLIKILVDHGANCSFVSANGESLLHKAVLEGKVGVIQKLMSMGAEHYSLNANSFTPFQLAIKMNRLGALKTLIRSNVDMNKRNPSTGDFLLHFAVSNGTVESVKLLVENGAETFVTNEDGLTPLILAIFLDKTEMIDVLYRASPVVNYKSHKNGNTPLHFAVMKKDLLSAEKLLKRGALVDALNGEGLTPLCKAAQINCGNIIKLLIKHGANINFKSAFGNTPLHLAVSERSITAVVTLAELRANLNEKDGGNLTPLCTAIGINATNIFNALLSKGASVNVLCSKEYPVYLAVRNSTLSVVKRLISLGNAFSVSLIIDKAVESNNPKILDYFLNSHAPLSEDEQGRLLLLAASSGSPDIIKELLKVGVPVDTASDTGFTPIWYATMNRKASAIKVLVENKADFHKTESYFRDGLDLRGWSLLHEAAFNNDEESLDVLLDAGVRVDVEDERTWTPLHYAAAQHNLGVIQRLVERGANACARTRMGELPIDLVKRRRSYEPIVLEWLAADDSR